MATIAINMFMSLDGVAQGPGGPSEDREGRFTQGGWTVPFFTEQLGEIIGGWHAEPSALLLGRKTYDIFAAHWPQVSDTDEDAPMAKILNETQKYVASRTLSSPTWQNTAVLDGEVPVAVAALKERLTGEIQVAGSLDLAQTLIAHDLIDEFRLTVFPVVLGAGKRLFAGGVPVGLELVSTETTESGVVACVYRRIGKPTYGSFGK
jgi:dihydrofolate reductase